MSFSCTQYLLQSYQMWVHPEYSLLEPEFLKDLVARFHSLRATSNDEVAEVLTGYNGMTLFYLVMTLRAANYNKTATNKFQREQLIPRPSAANGGAVFDLNP